MPHQGRKPGAAQGGEKSQEREMERLGLGFSDQEMGRYLG